MLAGYLFEQLTHYIHIVSRGVPIYRIGKISAADMAKFSVLAIGIFLKLYRYFYQFDSLNALFSCHQFLLC